MRGGERGQALVEFALILPLLILILFAIVDFAMALNRASDLNHIAAEGARRAAVNQQDNFDVKGYVTNAAEPGIRSDPDFAVAVCLPEGAAPGGTVKIRTSVPWSLLHLVPGLEEVTTINMSGRASMRLEAPAKFSQVDSNAACD